MATGEELIAAAAAHIRAQSVGEGSGHDWWHVHRVWQNARLIARGEDVDPVVVELAALLHDIADWKFHDGDLDAGPRAARAWLLDAGAEPALADRVADIVGRVSYKGAGVPDDMPSLEGRVVQDADRLDAMGAIGIGRAFAYGGHAGRLMYDPDDPPVRHDTAEAYVSSSGATLNHFPEKLLLLRDRMHTATGRRIADERHAYMEAFVERFLGEWQGEA
ncbi:HD domain-containing protein [Conexibacter sp. W3-3-2]|uniref:HD domain-containing protein n=1 Tax=Conexibacter sp. W3-3-2 TaxID=2675227 RepID=UPI00132617BC|nr:HD domain-containing protein [Conexibacter sp. W3-3-2]MTD43439.1 HD domain-containing protein [Conexibacter sp. W3-3-2]